MTGLHGHDDTESQSPRQPTPAPFPCRRRRRCCITTVVRRRRRATGGGRRDVDGELHASEAVAGEIADEPVGPGLGEHHPVVAAGVPDAHAVAAGVVAGAVGALAHLAHVVLGAHVLENCIGIGIQIQICLGQSQTFI